MTIINFDCHPFGRLKVYGDQLNSRDDFIVSSNTQTTFIDYLVFFDSRGVSSSYESSLAKMVVDQISANKKTFVLVCRPLNLTIWATLVGFMKLNNLIPKKIVTNMGFVDFTPKKKPILLETIQQVELAIGKDVAKSHYIESYPNSNGLAESLYSIRFDKRYLDEIVSITSNSELVILNTPLTDKAVCFGRPRPPCFYDAQILSNKFNRLITGGIVVDFPTFTSLHTYDAVHFTRKGNQLIFEKIINLL